MIVVFFFRSSRDKVLILWDLVKNTSLRTVPTFECIEGLIPLPLKVSFPALHVKDINVPHVLTAGDRGKLASFIILNNLKCNSNYKIDGIVTFRMFEGVEHE